MITCLDANVFICVCVYVCTFLCVYVFTCPCVNDFVYGRCVFVCYVYASPMCMFACARVRVCVCDCVVFFRLGLEATHTGRKREHIQDNIPRTNMTQTIQKYEHTRVFMTNIVVGDRR